MLVTPHRIPIPCAPASHRDKFSFPAGGSLHMGPHDSPFHTCAWSMHEPHHMGSHIGICALSTPAPLEPCRTHMCNFPSLYMGDTLLDGTFPGTGASHMSVACCNSSHMRSACEHSAWPPCGIHRSIEHPGPAGDREGRGLGGRAGGSCDHMCCPGGVHPVVGRKFLHRNVGGAMDLTVDLQAYRKSSGRILGREIWGRRIGIWGRTRWNWRGWRNWRNEGVGVTRTVCREGGRERSKRRCRTRRDQ